jgi:hypothetical protein
MVVSAHTSRDVDLKVQRWPLEQFQSGNGRVLHGIVPKLPHREGSEVEVVEEKNREIGEILENK